MNFSKSPEPTSEETITFVLKRSTRDRFYAKIFMVLFLTALSSYFFAQNGRQEYLKGRELTEEKYLENFEEYKANLIANKEYYENPFFLTFVVLIVMSFLIGSYELTVLAIGFFIGKIIK